MYQRMTNERALYLPENGNTALSEINDAIAEVDFSAS